MAKVTKIHGSKTPKRAHYIPEWAERRSMIQADICRETGVDKSTVSRWFEGSLPKGDNLSIVAGVLSIEPEQIFRHPDDDWLSALFAERSEDEKKRIIAMIEAAFPRTGTK